MKKYKTSPLFLAIFLKVLASFMNVLEPFILGLAITELTANLVDIAKGVGGAHLNVSYIVIILVIYYLRGLVYQIGSYGSNYFMTNANCKKLSVIFAMI